MSKSLSTQLKSWRKDAATLSYEESLTALDLLLEELQNDAVPLADLQQHYLRGQIYLERCEGLLLKAEQNVVQLNPDTLEPLDDA
ncbi:exodeoxyribonuclease VII small subunit [Synechococcus sp. CC9616]|jgi:exodeoxyribonuclease VII small subunit|uniref:exodeoxyribonuclease VII small subunit n=1 Tax=Synechococcus sp. CC9616 TaxID=110663 RepID=UPI00048DE5C8|nr:exodeoxyribonuclease VII small subunit [Synechococcus sp. CC9616]RPF84928.1 MAG: exodeoxyribonuclease VII small subunit [Synechococcus sp. TMED20]|tara:strand:- start:461 stop:715 length:255 start_codon:yes stop_codon:yes gene_type:complete